MTTLPIQQGVYHMAPINPDRKMATAIRNQLFDADKLYQVYHEGHLGPRQLLRNFVQLVRDIREMLLS
jgi:hypothetical protein